MAKKFKKQYFLFGGEITRILENDGIAKAIEAAKNDGTNYGLYEWDENSTPQALLDAADGWEGWMVITTAQYNKFAKL